jgi:hypothetical protein
MTLETLAAAIRGDDWIEDDKSHPFHIAAFLMERVTNRVTTGKFNAYQVSKDAAWFLRAGKRLAAYALQDCNGPELNDRQEATRDKLKEQIRIRAAWYDLTASCAGDPRGYVLRLDGEGVTKNGWGDGFGIA